MLANASQRTPRTTQAISHRASQVRILPRAQLEIDGFGADTCCVLSHMPSDTETEPLWSLGDKVLLGLIVFVMLGASAATFLGFFS